MEFDKVINACQPAKIFDEENLTDAQIEGIIKAGQAAPIAKDLQESFHIAAIRSERAEKYLREKDNLTKLMQDELKNGGPAYFIISVKEAEQSKESMFLYAGMIMAHMQLQATNTLLGFNFSSEQENVHLLGTDEHKEFLDIPTNYNPIQILKVGYTPEEINQREPYLSEVFTRIIS